MASKPVFSDVPAWPDQAASPPPAGHNRPPLDEQIPLDFREALLSERPDFLAKLDDLLGTNEAEGTVHRAYCSDDESLARCGSLVNTLRACEKHVDGVHQAVKAPYLLGGRLVDGQKNALVHRIIAGRQKVESLQQGYARKRQQEIAEQRAKEDAERRRLEELARENSLESALPPPPPEPVRAAPIRSDDGATVSTSTVQVATVTDYAKAFRHVKNDARVREAIDAAIARLVKATKATDLAGVTIRDEIRVNNR